MHFQSGENITSSKIVLTKIKWRKKCLAILKHFSDRSWNSLGQIKVVKKLHPPNSLEQGKKEKQDNNSDLILGFRFAIKCNQPEEKGKYGDH